jgi:hypothetical protein
MTAVVRIIQGEESHDIEIDAKVFAQYVAECGGSEETALSCIHDNYAEAWPQREVISFFRD